MFHEVAYPLVASESLERRTLARVNRLMARLVSRAAHRAFVSIPAWRPAVESLAAAGTWIEWLPVPTTIPVVGDAVAIARVRSRYAGGRPLVGCFGTFGAHVRVLLRESLPLLAQQTDCSILLIGKRSESIVNELTLRYPQLTGRVHATGALSAKEVSVHIHACDVMLQPYPDGVSTRRTSAMAALAHERALVTTSGALTEAFWALNRRDPGPGHRKRCVGVRCRRPVGRSDPAHAARLARARAIPESLRRHAHRQGAAAPLMMEVPRLSVVVPSFNNAAVLDRCLAGWERHAANQPVEVIVIEDGCRDHTPKLLEERSRTPWGRRALRWVHEDNVHELRSTNRGLREARAPLVLAWQDDMLLQVPWLVPELLRTFDEYDDLGLLCLSRGLELHSCRRPNQDLGRPGRLAAPPEHDRTAAAELASSPGGRRLSFARGRSGVPASTRLDSSTKHLSQRNGTKPICRSGSARYMESRHARLRTPWRVLPRG